MYKRQDDTHNASLPAMINAIKAFNTQTKFFKGNKIIAIGQISDLGKHSKSLHLQLVDVLENSNADYILCMDDALKSVVIGVKSKNITWYSNRHLLEKDLLYLNLSLIHISEPTRLMCLSRMPSSA